MSVRWDLFCQVVDNYGDIGVAWRLARQLTREHGAQVRLWVDHLPSFARLEPELDVHAALQHVQDVEVRLWSTDAECRCDAEVVIEAFGCELPPSYIASMAARVSPPLWINLEYLSAEDWVSGCHGLPSPQGNGLQKYFFFPGFDGTTGGVLREHELLPRRQAFQRHADERAGWLAARGIRPNVGERLFSLFGYEIAGLSAWLDRLAAGPVPTLLLVPEGRVSPGVNQWLGQPLPRDSAATRNNLRLQALPFMRQDEYDRLLWCCDFNLVRGEDSFLRAQWAGRPFLWHIYPQEEGAHLEKLAAFLSRYTANADAALAAALQAVFLALNQASDEAEKHRLADAWQALEALWPQWQTQAEQWCARLADRRDLASGLAHFRTNWLLCRA